MHTDVHIAIKNKFLIQVKDAVTEEVKGEFEAFNTITNQLIKDYVEVGPGSSSRNVFSSIAYGDGAGTPAMTDTALFSQISSLGATTVSSVSTLPTFQLVKTARIGASDAVGKVITEVGFKDSYQSLLTTHAMIVDSEGMPVGITKSATDIIDIYATVYFDIQNLEGVFGDKAGWMTYGFNVTSDYYYGRATNFLANWLFSGSAMDNSLGRITSYERGYPGAERTWLTGQLDDRSLAMSTNVAAGTKTFSTRYIETVSNGNIRGLVFNSFAVLQFPVPGVWEGIARVNKPVATGDGTAKGFDLPNAEVEQLKIYQDGVLVPPEAYTHNFKRYQDAKQYAYAWLPDQTKGIVDAYQLETEKNKVIFYDTQSHKLRFAILDTSLKQEYVNELDLATLFVKNTGGYFPKFGTLLNDTVFFVTGQLWKDIYFYDFDKTTMTIGTPWTKHANFPTYANNASIATGIYNPTIKGRVDSLFALCYVATSPGTWLGTANKNLFSFSLDAATKTIGANIAYAGDFGTSTVSALELNPTKNVLAVATSTTVLKTIAYEFATGTFGAIFNNVTIASGSAKWKPNGAHLFTPRVNSLIDRLYAFDEATNLLTVVRELTAGAATLSPLGAFLANGTWVSILTGTYYSDLRQVMVTPEEISTLTNVVDSSQSFSGSWIYWRDHTGSTASGLSGIWEIFPGMIMTTWKGGLSAGNGMLQAMFAHLDGTGKKQIEFLTAPPSGAVITCDYFIPYIPKDTNHILDLSVTYNFAQGF